MKVQVWDFVAFSHWFLHAFLEVIHFYNLWGCRSFYFGWLWHFFLCSSLGLLFFRNCIKIRLKDSAVRPCSFYLSNIKFSLFNKSSNIWGCKNICRFIIRNRLFFGRFGCFSNFIRGRGLYSLMRIAFRINDFYFQEQLSYLTNIFFLIINLFDHTCIWGCNFSELLIWRNIS